MRCALQLKEPRQGVAASPRLGWINAATLGQAERQPGRGKGSTTDQGGNLYGSAAIAETDSQAPWGLSRMAPLRNGSPSLWRYAGIDPATQTGRWMGEDGAMMPAELGKHGSSVNTYPPTQVGKDGKVDPDTGQDAQQD